MLREADRCAYCGAPIHIGEGDSHAVCAYCGREMEVAGFIREEKKLIEVVEDARRSSEQAAEQVRIKMDELSRAYSRELENAVQLAKNGLEACREALSAVTDRLDRSDARRLRNLFAQAEEAQRAGRFEDAEHWYRQVLVSAENEAEVHWRLVMCCYGVEYVREQASGRYLPTISHMVVDSVLENANYQAAVRCARSEKIRRFYEAEARHIDRILDKYRQVAATEAPYDVFISVKQGDEKGNPTPDSLEALKIHAHLTNVEKLRVFNSRVSLENHAGEEYEPYIMAALMSAKVMIVLGTKAEYIASPWVRNEWRRFRWLKDNGSGQPRRLIAYVAGDLQIRDLPREMGELQAIDGRSSMNPMETLIGNIRQAIGRREEGKISSGGDGSDALLTRAELFLEDGDFERADEYCERVLDSDPTNARAYVLKLCVEMGVRSESALAECREPIEDKGNYKKALRFADEPRRTMLEGYARAVRDRLNREADEQTKRKREERLAREKAEREAREKAERAAQEKAERERREKAEKEAKLAREKAEREARIAREKAEREAREKEKREQPKPKKKQNKKSGKAAVIAAVALIAALGVVWPQWNQYQKANALQEAGRQNEAIPAYEKVWLFPNAADELTSCAYQWGEKLQAAGDYDGALEYFGLYAETENTLAAQAELRARTEEIDALRAGMREKMEMAKRFKRMVGIGSNHIILFSGGDFGEASVSTMLTEDKDYVNDLDGMMGVSAVAAAPQASFAVTSEGTVVSDSILYEGLFGGRAGFVNVSAGIAHVVAQQRDGTLLAAHSMEDTEGACDVESWGPVTDFDAGTLHTVAVLPDGTARATGKSNLGQCDVSGWTDLAAISTGGMHTLGLRSDGTVLYAGSGKMAAEIVKDWKNIVSIAAGDNSAGANSRSIGSVGVDNQGNVHVVGHYGSEIRKATIEIPGAVCAVAQDDSFSKSECIVICENGESWLIEMTDNGIEHRKLDYIFADIYA